MLRAQSAYPPFLTATLESAKSAPPLTTKNELEAALQTCKERDLPVLLHRLCLAGSLQPSSVLPLLELAGRLPSKSKDERKARGIKSCLRVCSRSPSCCAWSTSCYAAPCPSTRRRSRRARRRRWCRGCAPRGFLQAMPG